MKIAGYKSFLLLQTAALIFYIPTIECQGENSTVALNFDYKECKQHCIDYEKTTLMNTTDCQGSLSFSVEARKACTKGTLKAFAHICFPSCMGEPDTFRNDDAGNSYNSCKVFWKKPNDELPWCRMGYDRTFIKVKHAMNKLRTDSGHRQLILVMNQHPQEEEHAGVVDKNTILDDTSEEETSILGTVKNDEQQQQGAIEGNIQANAENNQQTDETLRALVVDETSMKRNHHAELVDIVEDHHQEDEGSNHSFKPEHEEMMKVQVVTDQSEKIETHSNVLVESLGTRLEKQQEEDRLVVDDVTPFVLTDEPPLLQEEVYDATLVLPTTGSSTSTTMDDTTTHSSTNAAATTSNDHDSASSTSTSHQQEQVSNMHHEYYSASGTSRTINFENEGAADAHHHDDAFQIMTNHNDDDYEEDHETTSKEETGGEQQRGELYW
jgi:hypothetical protein